MKKNKKRKLKIFNVTLFIIIILASFLSFKLISNNNESNKDNDNTEIVNDKKEDEIKKDPNEKLKNHKYYIDNNLEKYLSYMNLSNLSLDNDEDINYTIQIVNSNCDKDFYTDIKDTDLSKGDLILVNKYHRLSSDYVPDDLVTASSTYGRTLQVKSVAYEAFKQMFNDALKEGLHIYIRSPYRSYSTQNYLYENYAASDGYDLADTYSARPGFSEHQTGLAIDIVASDDSLGNFHNTKEFLWVKDNAHKYGFILRYPQGKEYLTGYQYESWHYRYVGISAATKIYNEDITFEEYYAYYIEKN